MRLRIFDISGLMILILFCSTAYAKAHSVNLAWTASTDSGVSYNIYRFSGACPTTGTTGFSKITTAPVNANTFMDSVGAPGTYCYYATSVLNGAESVPSNLTSAVILPAAPTALSITGTN